MFALEICEVQFSLRVLNRFIKMFDYRKRSNSNNLFDMHWYKVISKSILEQVSGTIFLATEAN